MYLIGNGSGESTTIMCQCVTRTCASVSHEHVPVCHTNNLASECGEFPVVPEQRHINSGALAGTPTADLENSIPNLAVIVLTAKPPRVIIMLVILK